MKITIYQINMDRDQDRVCFLAHQSLPKFQGSSDINAAIYDKVYEAEVACQSLEYVYTMFNLHQPEDYRGRSLSVSDVVMVTSSPEVEDGFYFCDSFGFQKVSFNSDQALFVNQSRKEKVKMNIDEIKEMYPKGTVIELVDMPGEIRMQPGLKGRVVGVDDIGQIHMTWDNGSTLAINLETDTINKIETPNYIRVLLVKPGRSPELVDIADDLSSMQEAVGGMIEQYMPFDDDVAIICNEEGKMNGMPLNRAIYDSQHQLMDIIAGDFFVAYAPIESENFLSMPDDKAKKYEEKFHNPERFYSTAKGIVVESIRENRSYEDR